jgi:hypothetical protein
VKRRFGSRHVLIGGIQARREEEIVGVLRMRGDGGFDAPAQVGGAPSPELE